MVAQSSFDNTANVLYFGDDIDFRLIPKNVSTTLKIMWSDFNGLPYITNSNNPHKYFPHKMSSLGARRRRVLENGGLWRNDTLKFVVKRDPVERWVSAINFAIIMKEYGRYEEFAELEWVDKDINDIAKDMRELGIGDVQEFSLTELYSQTWCAGNISQYDHVFDIREFGKCKALMEEILGEPLIDIESTVTKDKSKWTKKDLTSKAIDDIKVLYKKDYDNGWC